MVLPFFTLSEKFFLGVLVGVPRGVKSRRSFSHVIHQYLHTTSFFMMIGMFPIFSYPDTCTSGTSPVEFPRPGRPEIMLAGNNLTGVRHIPGNCRCL